MNYKSFILILGIFLVVILSFFVSADIFSINSGGDNGLIINPDLYIEGFFSNFNSAPWILNVRLLSVDFSNESDSNLNCSGFLYDAQNDFLNASVRWYKNNALTYQIDFNDSYSNSSLFSGILMSGNLSLGDVWKCSLRAHDGMVYSNWVNSTTLTIIDITKPNITIISPNATNYTTLNIPFNVSVQDNEGASKCWYSLDGLANVTMTTLNATDFGDVPLLGPGPHDLIFYCNDTSNNVNHTNFSFEILNEAAIAIDLSDELLGTVQWNVISLPINNLDAVGNNGAGITQYWLNISVTNTLADLYVRADGDLLNDALDSLGLENETFSYTKNDNLVNTTNISTMSTSYILIGDALQDGDTIYLKFFLDAPASQPAGTYLNSLEFKAVRDGQSP